MEYKNTKTGATFSSSCVISGGDWVLIEDKHQPLNQEVQENDNEEVSKETENQEVQENDQENANEEKTGDATFDSITVPQIKQELDAFGIEYNPRAKKQELYDLMMSQGK